jgi:hypothetical protein
MLGWICQEKATAIYPNIKICHVTLLRTVSYNQTNMKLESL